LIIHGFFSSVHSAATFGQPMGFTTFGSLAVALLGFPVGLTPGGHPALPGTIYLSSPATPAHAKPQTTPTTHHLTQ